MTMDTEGDFISYAHHLKKMETSDGCVVMTKSGKGVISGLDGLVNGKIPVRLDDGRRIACSPEKITIIEYIENNREAIATHNT